MATKVAGELYESITGQLFEVGRQLRQPGGYPYDPEKLKRFLQRAIEGRFGEKLKLAFAQAFDSAKFIGKNWSVWKGPADGNGLEGEEDRDVREDNLSIVDFEQLILETNLQEEETVVNGEEKLKRLKAGKNICLGGKAFLALWEDYQARKAEGKPEESVLEKLRKAKNMTCIYFFGLVLRGPCGYRFVLYLYFSGEEWYWLYGWLVDDWHAGDPSASLASVN